MPCIIYIRQTHTHVQWESVCVCGLLFQHRKGDSWCKVGGVVFLFTFTHTLQHIVMRGVWVCMGGRQHYYNYRRWLEVGDGWMVLSLSLLHTHTICKVCWEWVRERKRQREECKSPFFFPLIFYAQLCNLQWQENPLELPPLFIDVFKYYLIFFFLSLFISCNYEQTHQTFIKQVQSVRAEVWVRDTWTFQFSVCCSQEASADLNIAL